MTDSDSGNAAEWLRGPAAHALADAGRSRSLLAHTTLCREGQVTDSCFLVTAGQFEISKRIEGRRYLLSTFGPGTLLGLMPALDGQPYAVTIAAACDAEVIEIGRERLRAVLEQGESTGPQIADRLSLLAIRRLRNATNELAREICHTIRSATHQGRIDGMRLARIQASGYAWLDS